MNGPDICANRHGGNPQSQRAFREHRGAFAKQKADVYAAVCAADQRAGLTCKELATALGVGMNTLSGRFSELRLVDNVIEQARDEAGKPIRRDGCAAYRKSVEGK